MTPKTTLWCEVDGQLSLRQTDSRGVDHEVLLTTMDTLQLTYVNDYRFIAVPTYMIAHMKVIIDEIVTVTDSGPEDHHLMGWS